MKNLLIVAFLLVLISACAPNTNTSVNTVSSQQTQPGQSSTLTPNQIWHRNHKIVMSVNEKACGVSEKLRKAVLLCSPLVYIGGEIPDSTEDEMKQIVDGVYQGMYTTESYFETFKKADPDCNMIPKIDYYFPTAKKDSKALVDQFYSDLHEKRYINLCKRVKEYTFMDSFNGICNETNPHMYPVPLPGDNI